MIDLSKVRNFYVACGLSPSYFYPHLLEKGLHIKAFLQKDEDNIYCKCISDDYLEFGFFNGELDDVLTQMSRELFYVLFQNRDFLFRFNVYMANANPARVERCNIPNWVKRAVKYRDRGRCVCCGIDLSGYFDCEDEGAVHYDQIVSLHEGGINDVSNIQLMCRKCNLSKSGQSFTSIVSKVLNML